MDLQGLAEQVQLGSTKNVRAMVRRALEEHIPPETILYEGLLRGMNRIAEKFKTNEIYIPEVILASRAMNNGIAELKPYLSKESPLPNGKVCLGTVRGDLHDIGKNLVKLMLEGRGLTVIDLGTDVPPEAFIETAILENCAVILCSALLTSTMPVIGEVVEEARRRGVRDRFKIMVGGAPVTETFCREIGADAYTADAASAAERAYTYCLEADKH